MIKSDEMRLGCLAHAKDDEPVFVLRAKDRLAPMVVRIWIAVARGFGVSESKLRDAVSIARQMEQYAKEHYNGGKLPD